ncbi:2',5'-phosphodiesterase 12-like [Clytia hemisphaerica]|uniref:Endonuclease/exonuclease/phosphatase domain-containing protein n=1 Tax=Clytia hemisphaerica TaxID=252671 RepID=A0A7M5WY20_9CNID
MAFFFAPTSTRTFKNLPTKLNSVYNSSKLLLKGRISRTTSKMASPVKTNKLFIRSLPDEPNLKINFKYNNQCMEFNRQKTDTVNKTIQRISLKLSGGGKKKKKNKKNVASMESKDRSSGNIDIKLLDNSGNVLNLETTSNENAFVKSNQFQITNDTILTVYNMVFNAPNVIDIKPLNTVMAGFPVFPELTFEFGQSEFSQFQWYKKLPDSTDWILAGENLIFTPSVEDIGFELKLSCQSGNEDEIREDFQEFVFTEPISAGPGQCLFDKRHMYTRKKHDLKSNELRVVCYNVLADIFATSDYARNTLFPYAPEYVLSLSYRKLLLIKELLGYNADLISLQECGMKLFNSYLNPVMNLNGYQGLYFGKLGTMPEGEALFYRTDRYRHIKELSIPIREVLYLECNIEILSALSEVPELLEKFHKKTAVGQIHILEEIETKRQLCIFNTHLYYKRYYQHIRVMQIAVLMNYLSTKIDASKMSVIVNGDLNSLRNDDLLPYLSGTEIDSHSPLWHPIRETNPDFTLSLKSPILLQNASGCPPYTSFVPHCMETLDYIFCDSDFEVTALLPMPEPEEFEPYVGLPCIGSPSDHLALVLDLKWNKKKN